jgi:hypothetical protein
VTPSRRHLVDPRLGRSPSRVDRTVPGLRLARVRHRRTGVPPRLAGVAGQVRPERTIALTLARLSVPAGRRWHGRTGIRRPPVGRWSGPGTCAVRFGRCPPARSVHRNLRGVGFERPARVPGRAGRIEFLLRPPGLGRRGRTGHGALGSRWFGSSRWFEGSRWFRGSGWLGRRPGLTDRGHDGGTTHRRRSALRAGVTRPGAEVGAAGRYAACRRAFGATGTEIGLLLLGRTEVGDPAEFLSADLRLLGGGVGLAASPAASQGSRFPLLLGAVFGQVGTARFHW